MNATTHPAAATKAVASRFSYVKYDQQSQDLQQALKQKFEEIETICNTHLTPTREQALILTNLEVAYMWTGKAIRNAQVARTGDGAEQAERSAE